MACSNITPWAPAAPTCWPYARASLLTWPPPTWATHHVGQEQQMLPQHWQPQQRSWLPAAVAVGQGWGGVRQLGVGWMPAGCMQRQQPPSPRGQDSSGTGGSWSTPAHPRQQPRQQQQQQQQGRRRPELSSSSSLSSTSEAGGASCACAANQVEQVLPGATHKASSAACHSECTGALTPRTCSWLGCSC
jgi:hypothetical protein